MIPIHVYGVKLMGTTTFYALDKMCHFNPSLVCVVKPALDHDNHDDIMTVDGNAYRVRSDIPNLGILKLHGESGLKDGALPRDKEK